MDADALLRLIRQRTDDRREIPRLLRQRILELRGGPSVRVTIDLSAPPGQRVRVEPPPE